MDDKQGQVMSLLPPLPEDVIDRLPPEWLDQLWEIYSEVKKSRLRELNGDRRTQWRGDGLHRESYMWGQLDCLTPAWLSDALADHVDPEHSFSPRAVSNRALAQATDEYVDRLLASRQ